MVSFTLHDTHNHMILPRLWGHITCSLVPRPSHHPVFDHLQGGGMPSSFHHVNDISNVIYMIKWTRPSPSVFVYYKWSKTGWWESLEMRLSWCGWVGFLVLWCWGRPRAPRGTGTLWKRPSENTDMNKWRFTDYNSLHVSLVTYTCTGGHQGLRY